MHEPRILEANIDKRAEVDNVEHRPLELHSRGQILDLQDALLEDRFGKVFTRVAIRTRQGLDNVAQRELAKVQLA